MQSHNPIIKFSSSTFAIIDHYSVYLYIVTYTHCINIIYIYIYIYIYINDSLYSHLVSLIT